MTEEQFEALAEWIDTAVAASKGLASPEVVEQMKERAREAFCGKTWGQGDAR